jgi:hypothetical protein
MYVLDKGTICIKLGRNIMLLEGISSFELFSQTYLETVQTCNVGVTLEFCDVGPLNFVC